MESTGPLILIVDDDTKNVRLLEAILKMLRYRTIGAYNGEEAIESMREQRPDLVLLDIMMPGIDGYETCRRIRADEDLRATPVVMVTALSEPEDHLNAIEAGADDFIRKPIDQHELTLRIRSLLRIKSFQDELIEKNAALGALEERKADLMNMIVHDLNSPLTIVMYALDMIEAKYRVVLAEDDLSSLKDGQRATSTVSDMVRNILDIARMEATDVPLERCQTDMLELAEDVVRALQTRAEPFGISIDIVGGDEPTSAMIDPALTRRIVGNLLDNAIRHSPPGERIVVEAWPRKDQGLVEIRVRDNGPGVAPELHSKIFDRFEQARDSTAGGRRGSSGLGLAFCRMAVHAQGGKIWIESAGSDTGSTFAFTMPEQPPAH